MHVDLILVASRLRNAANELRDVAEDIRGSDTRRKLRHVAAALDAHAANVAEAKDREAEAERYSAAELNPER